MNNSKHKILLMIDEASIGGGQQHVLWLADRLNKNAFDVSVACEPQGYLVEELQRRNITHYPITITNSLSIKGLIQCILLLKRVAPDILHTHGGTAGFYGRLASFCFRKIKVIHTFHGIHYLHFTNRYKKRFYNFIDLVLRPVTDYCICVSRKDFNSGLRAKILSKKKSAVIYNGIDLTYLHTDNGKRTNGNTSIDKKIIVGTIGRLHQQKGHKYLIQAARTVVEKFPHVEFHIIGDGELRNELESLRDGLGLSRNIFFVGAQKDISAYLAGFTIFVLPSLWEGLPIVLLEAMAARKPIISTDVDGISELLEDKKTALFVPSKNPGLLAETIIKLLCDDAMQQTLIDNAFQKVKTQFSIEEMVKKIEDVYERVLQ